ncbi:hypothetical protein C5S30_00555, partial [ANME-1 cluster archaeon GoMg4]|nr:hypothetical protein [ANME-1 cluster archaeon GoMg4]
GCMAVPPTLLSHRGISSYLPYINNGYKRWDKNSFMDEWWVGRTMKKEKCKYQNREALILHISTNLKNVESFL